MVNNNGDAKQIANPNCDPIGFTPTGETTKVKETAKKNKPDYEEIEINQVAHTQLSKSHEQTHPKQTTLDRYIRVKWRAP
jgi:hypothetical protein